MTRFMSYRRLRIRAWVSSAATALLCVTGCSGGSDSGIPVPLTDGLYLRYTANLTSGGAQVSDAYQYEFHALDNRKWRVIETAGQYHTGHAQAVVIDEGGTVVQSEGELTQWKVGRRFNDLWLASSERKAGSAVRPLDDPCDYKVGDVTQWQRWQAIPAVCGGEATTTLYYEASTGWLVGSLMKSQAGARVDELSETNAVIPGR